MLNPSEFLRTVYFGDRACKAIRIESWEGQFVMVVDKISRIRSASGLWEFYTSEDIPDGEVVFTGVESVHFEPSGPIPNDYINGITARQLEGDLKNRWVFEVSVGSVSADSITTEIVIRIIGTDVFIVNPAQGGFNIRE